MDPAVELIERYLHIEGEYNRCSEKQPDQLKALEKSHCDVMGEITASTFVATSQSGALAAIRQALAEEKLSVGRTLTIALLEMGLGYFNAAPPADDAKLIELGRRRADLVVKREPLRVERERLWDVATEAWMATGYSIDADVPRWQKHMADHGYTAAEDADSEVLDQINALDEAIRAIRATTVKGLASKFDVHRAAMNIDDDEPCCDQDWHIFNFNEFADELCRVAGNAVPGLPAKEQQP